MVFVTDKKAISELERQLIALLRRDPQLPTKQLAQALAVTEKTVLNRINSLAQRNLLSITGQWDMHALGLNVVGHVYADIGHRAITGIEKTLANIEEVQAFAELPGSPSLSVMLVVDSVKRFYEVVHTKLAAIKGLRVVETEIFAELTKFNPEFTGGVHVNRWRPCLQSLTPRIKLDETDMAITSLLLDDGRTSNADIAKHLGVSDALVWKRLKRLQDVGAFRKTVVFNPLALDLNDAAIVRCKIEGAIVDSYCDHIKQWENSTFVMKTIGQYNLLVLMQGIDQRHIATQLRQNLRKLPRVYDYTVTPIIEVYQYRCGLALLQ